MKMKFVEGFDKERVKGYEVEVDKIRYDLGVAGLYAVRVISVWKKPAWLAIAWFIHPNAGRGLVPREASAKARSNVSGCNPHRPPCA